MDKQQILSFIREQLAIGKITQADLASIMGTDQTAAPLEQRNVASEGSSKKIISVMYVIGAIIAILGVTILIAQNWSSIGLGGRLLVTLGIAVVAYIAGLLLRKPEQNSISQIMFLISAVLTPLGSYVLVNGANLSFTLETQLFAAVISAVIFGTALFASRRDILKLIVVGYATWAYYAVVIKLFGTGYLFSTIDHVKWATLLLGLSYILVGYGISSNRVTSILYGLGTIAFLGGGIVIGGFFDLIYIALLFAVLYGSVYLKSRATLVFGSLFLMAHLIKLTAEYFVDSIGWPIALIFAGFVVIAIGYMTYWINKKYLKP